MDLRISNFPTKDKAALVGIKDLLLTALTVAVPAELAYLTINFVENIFVDGIWFFEVSCQIS